MSVEWDDAWGVVRVRDTGRGIAPDAVDSVFDLFVRANTDTKGLGIGLAVANRLVELHGGRIEVHSEGLGRGTEFVTRWPLATDPAAPARDGKSVRPDSAASAPAGATQDGAALPGTPRRAP